MQYAVGTSVARPKNLQKKGGESLVMKRTNNNEKGITLIALIITIIILVILAAVSIRAVYNMGIVNYAVNGTQDYAQKAVEENKTIYNTENLLGRTLEQLEEINSRLRFELPNGFQNNFFEQIVIYESNKKYTTDFDVSTLKNSSTKTYYMSPNGNDSNSGLSKEAPLKTFTKVLELYNSGDTVILLEGMYSRKNWTNVDYPDITKSINIIGENEKVYIKQGDDYTFTENEQYNNVYQTARSNVNQVLDITNLSSGNIEQLIEVESIEDCYNTFSSYYSDGTNVYIHMRENRIPTNQNIIVNLKVNAAAFNINNITENAKVYLENITVLGGYKSNISAYTNGEYIPIVLAKNCKFLYNKKSSSATYSAVHMRGCYSIFQNCEASYSNNDGFSYHSFSNKPCYAIEINCVGAHNGNETELSTFNGTTIHDGGKILRVNGEYYNNYGANVADVNDETISVNLGCYAHNSEATTGGYNADFAAQQSGTTMYIYSCKAEGSKYSIWAHDGTVVYLKNCIYNTIYGDNNIKSNS